MSAEAEKTLRTSLRRAAMDLLARREHSRAELFEKVLRKFPDQDALLGPVLDQLEHDGLLSDERFTEAYVRYRRNRGFGPLIIRQELRNKGIAEPLMQEFLSSDGALWRESLRAIIARKTAKSSCDPLDAKARQRLHRFCLGRGFSPEDIRRALRADSEF